MIEFNENTLDDPSVPEYVRVNMDAMMSMLGVSSRSSVFRAIDRKEIPPGFGKKKEWTIGQLREWRVMRGRMANVEAMLRQSETDKIAEMACSFVRKIAEQQAAS